MKSTDFKYPIRNTFSPREYKIILLILAQFRYEEIKRKYPDLTFANFCTLRGMALHFQDYYNRTQCRVSTNFTKFLNQYVRR